MRGKRTIAIAVLVLVAFLIAYPPLASGSVKVALSPSSHLPVEHLYVIIGEISAHRADTREPEGWFLMSKGSNTIDLAEANSTQTATLASISLGQYDMIRVTITNATAFVNNTSKTVQLPSSVFTIPVSLLVRLGVQTVIVLKVTSELQMKPEATTLVLSFTAVGEKSAS